MSSFLQKLKRKGVAVENTDQGASGASAQNASKTAIPQGVTQLPVDVYQNDSEIVIFAQVPGVEIKDLDVSIEGDNDVITVQGQAHRPHNLVTLKETGGDGQSVPIGHGEDHTSFTLEECVWGKFFRQIILPQEVDASSAQAKIKDGVLVLHLPLKGHSSNRIRMQVQKFDSGQSAA
jgi:HSP20 family protein